MEKSLKLFNLNMKLEAFIQSIDTEKEPPNDISNGLKALWWEKKEIGKNQDIAQEMMSTDGSWIHAYLHRVEGDLGNAAYWYNRAGKPIKRNEDQNEEWNKSWKHCWVVIPDPGSITNYFAITKKKKPISF